MKLLTNMTTSIHDLPRYQDNRDLKQFYRELGLDGLELLEGGKDERGVVAADDVVGFHLRFFNDWLGFWRGDWEAVLREYGGEETARQVFGGLSREALVESYRKNLETARRYSPEYAVFHVSNVSLQQCITREKTYTDEEVIEGVIELINQIFDADFDPFFAEGRPLTLLFENLWWSGLTLTRPEITRRLLEGVRYPHTGIMLDTGHLLNTNTALRSLDAGADYINHILDRYDELRIFKGVHLHQSLSGEYVERILREPLVLAEGTYFDKVIALHRHIISIDNHKPWKSERIGTFLKRINPEYLVLELVSSNLDEHGGSIREQRTYLPAMARR
jgi:sugar phosphate isomerase/epimerase